MFGKAFVDKRPRLVLESGAGRSHHIGAMMWPQYTSSPIFIFTALHTSPSLFGLKSSQFSGSSAVINIGKANTSKFKSYHNIILP